MSAVDGGGCLSKRHCARRIISQTKVEREVNGIMATTTMASTTDIQIVNITNLEKIESFLNDSAYKEMLENSETYNTRLCIERRLRMPFLDPQTGVAQANCALFMKRRQRMPGLREGQIYTYPSGRWRKSRRQYLIHQHRPFRMIREPECDSNIGTSLIGTGGSSSGGMMASNSGGSSGTSGIGGGAGSGGTSSSSAGVLVSNVNANSGGSVSMMGDADSRDSHRDEPPPPKEWFYDEVNMHEIDSFEDRDLDSDFDYDDNSYNKKKRRGRKPHAEGGTPRGRGRGRGRGRRKMLADGDRGDAPTRTPTKRGRPSGGGTNVSTPALMPLQSSSVIPPQSPAGSGPTLAAPQTMQLMGTSSGTTTTVPAFEAEATSATPMISEQAIVPGGGVVEEDDRGQMLKPSERNKATPSPYCDFCLGDSRENRKTNIPEDLVSCSDCGRSGHPTCLQFTPNMIISVRRYRWQCIECKYCSICGTSDNDDQLLFCDDCDRGYHMYCLTPPLTVPPEGSWSCNICHEEFHSNK